MCLSNDEKKNFGLIELEKLLQFYNKYLKDYPQMPILNYDDAWVVDNRLLFNELSYDRDALHEESQKIERQLTDE